MEERRTPPRAHTLPETIQLAHGTGGRLTHQLIEQLFLEYFRNPYLEGMNDQAILPGEGGRLAMSTDAFVVKPYRFPGGNIGDLAVNGTVNDLVVGGATPLYLSASFILEEGLPVRDLVEVVESMAAASAAAGVQVVTGDTKVVERGSADGLYITTSGIGRIPEGIDWGPHRIREGDVVILSGSVGDHGASVMIERFEMEFDTQIESDTACLRDLVEAVRDVPGIRCMRDPTRGGLATTLNELSQSSGLNLRIRERDVPIRDEVRGLCEALGIDPLYVANEGKLVCVVAPEEAEEVVRRMRRVKEGREARIIGEVTGELPGLASLETLLGAVRVLDLLAVEQLPRIC
ncbi:hydrogenase expression/formation protein HypE [Kyrpidia spormannii]|uniref:Carbamoyl phosphate phosphatase, hydrogenase 3 maturation protein n=2 Tax=Kyrpidia spormannii TaxID=2055160 RepID=A0A6F9E7I2_9BACL|nr:hydrogenase expression/formation protein HypE [Kyrpidia spormannii]CAB3391571.1 Hydrogenase expression/formation protein, HypE [Kyrpidia spormannii]CAB3392483.1 carbamoyl phosphate phosphatase, hydrogenase 3 maturation protein [Kyrpidia spormannii]